MEEAFKVKEYKHAHTYESLNNVRYTSYELDFLNASYDLLHILRVTKWANEIY